MAREAPLSIVLVASLLVAAIPFAPSAVAAGENLVPNPSFETKRSAATTMPDQWRAFALGVGVAMRSPVQAADGAFSLAFVGAPRLTSAEVMWVRSDLVPFPAVCPTSGTFSFQADVLEGGLQGAVEYYRADGTWIRSDLLPAGANPGWERYSATFESPPGATKVAFTFAVTSILGVTAHLDDVRYTVAASPFRFCEDWEDGTSGWWMESGTGATRDCTRATDGSCSLRLENPHCCGEPYVRVSKDLGLALLPTQTVTWDFQGSSTSGDRNALVQLRFGGAAVNVDWTYGPTSSNNGLNIINYDQPGQSSTVNWPNANRWYRIVVTIDGTSHLVSATLIDLTTNAPVGTTTSVGFVGSTLQGISFQQVMWSSSTNTHHVDRLRIT